RLRVHDDGSTSHLSGFALRSSRWASVLWKVGFSLMALAMGLGPILAAAIVITLFLAGMALCVVDALVSWPVTVRWASRLGSGWHRPTNLNGWEPRSSAQIAVVESIARGTTAEHGYATAAAPRSPFGRAAGSASITTWSKTT